MKIRLLVVLIILAMAVPGLASEFRNGQAVSIPSGSAIPDDLYAFGQSVDVAGTVEGDLISAGGSVTMSGATTGSAIIAGRQLITSGKIGNDLLAAGKDVQISGPIADNATVAGQTVNLWSAGSVGRDLTAAGGQVTVDGKIGRNVVARTQDLIIGPNAVIQGNLIYSSPKAARIDPGARIMGRTIYTPIAPHRARPAFKGLIRVLGLLGLFLVGVLLIALAPAAAVGSADRMRTAPWISILTGLIILVVAPMAIAVAFATVIGIPLALILLASYLIALYASLAYAGIGIGRWLFTKFGNPNSSLYVDLLIGLIILAVLTAIPFIGGLVKFVALILGLGALAIEQYAMSKSLKQEGKL